MLNLILGSTTYAVTLVLIAFMAGLALGSYLAGRLIDKSEAALNVYALLEAGVGLFALLSPVLLGLITPLYVWLWAGLEHSPQLLYLTRLFLAFVVLVIPTSLMGATLPVLSKFVIRSRSALGTGLGSLYGYNTLGATLGCFLTGFVFMQYLGITLTIVVAAILNIGIALIAFRLGRQPLPVLPQPPVRPETAQSSKKPSRPPTTAAEPRYGRPVLRLVLVMFGLSGFVSLGYEVLWTKAVSFFAGNTSYAFSTMLTTFLAGIGAGSLAASRFSDRLKRPLLSFGLAEMLIGLCAIATIPLFARLFYVFRPEIYGENTATPVWMKFLFSFLTMFLPTLLMGAVFPLVGRIYTHSLNRIGSSVGLLYSVNTIGSILGSAAAGFLLVPLLGIRNGILALALLQIAMGAIVVLAGREVRSVRRYSLAAAGAATTMVVIMLLPGGGRMFSSAHRPHMPEGTPLYYREGVCNTVEVIQESQGNRFLILDGGVNSTTSPDGVGLRIHRLMSQQPLLLPENPQSILLIAFGAGVTAGATLAFDELRTIDCAEISRDVVEAADFFRSWNHDVVHSPRFHLTIEDGRNFVLTAPRTYDVVTAGIIHPKNNAGNAGFYNRDFYEVCKTRLNRGGIVCQWAPLYGLTVDEFKMIIATFLDVFPHASLWFAQSYGQMGNSNALLIGSPEAVEWRYSRLRERFAHRGLADDLRGEGIESPVELLDCFVVGARALRDFAGGGTARTTDNHPRLEFGGITMAYDTLLALLADIREPVWPYLVDLRDAAGPERLAVIDSLQRQFEISNYCIRGDIGELAKNYNSALADYGRALAVQPENSDLRAVYRALQVQANNSLLRECLTNTRGQMDVVRSLSQRLQYKPDDAESQFNIGVVYQQRGWLDAALVQYQDALRFAPDNTSIRYNLAILYNRKGQTRQAVEELERVVERDPTVAAAYIQLGVIYKRLGHPASAREMFLKALALDPKNAVANEGLASLE